MPSRPYAAWKEALVAHEGCMFSRLRAAVAAAGDRRIWAVDASAGNGGAAPKFYIVAEPTAFATAYLRVRMEERHAYEVIDEGCWIHAFFDLDAPAVTALDLENGSAAANRVVTAAVAALAELAALREPGRLPLEVDVLVLDATRPVGTEGACDRYIIDSNRFFHVRHVRQLTSGATERYFSHMRQVSRAHVRPGDRYFSPARRVERVDADGWRTSARGASRHASHTRGSCRIDACKTASSRLRHESVRHEPHEAASRFARVSLVSTRHEALVAHEPILVTTRPRGVDRPRHASWRTLQCPAHGMGGPYPLRPWCKSAVESLACPSTLPYTPLASPQGCPPSSPLVASAARIH